MNALYERLKQANRYVFDVDLDIQIINAYRQGIRFVGVSRVDMPLYRCHFFENEVVICSLGYMTPREYKLIQKVFKESGLKPFISFFVLFDNKVVMSGSVDAGKLVHVLFHLHHRVISRFVLKDYVAGIYE